MIDFRKVFSMPRTSSYTGALGAKGYLRMRGHANRAALDKYHFAPDALHAGAAGQAAHAALGDAAALAGLRAGALRLGALALRHFRGGSVGMAM